MNMQQMKKGRPNGGAVPTEGEEALPKGEAGAGVWPT